MLPSMAQGWRGPTRRVVLAALVAFAVLSILAAAEQRGLTWWDPVIIVAAGVIAFLAGRLRWR
jgi:hypothetical protein